MGGRNTSSRAVESWIRPAKATELPLAITPLAVGDAEVEEPDSSEVSAEVTAAPSKAKLPLLDEQPFYWFKQRFSTHAAVEAGTLFASCSGKPFLREPSSFGEACESARGVVGTWCKECLRKLPLSTTECLVQDK